MICRALLLAFFMAFFAPVAMAGEPLIFRDKTKNIREESVIAYLQSQKKIFAELPYKIATVDLNFDGVNEWIIRQERTSACEVTASCSFYVVGLSKNAPLLLGEFPARKVGIDDQKIYGIKTLQVYNLKNDDFDFTQYRWTPQKSAFLPLGG